jgi:uncharacterized protein (DUF1697 family)
VPAKTPSTHVVLLRGINVGGKNKLPMTDLVAILVAAGCAKAKTYIQSGNVVCTAPATVAKRLPSTVETAIFERWGYRIPIVMRTAAELHAVTQGNPFLKTGGAPETLHVAFLADVPEPARASALDPKRSPPDELVVRGRDIYLCMPNGVARSKLTNAYFDSALDTTSTIRNWRTVLQLVEMARS